MVVVHCCAFMYYLLSCVSYRPHFHPKHLRNVGLRGAEGERMQQGTSSLSLTAPCPQQSASKPGREERPGGVPICAGWFDVLLIVETTQQTNE